VKSLLFENRLRRASIFLCLAAGWCGSAASAAETARVDVCVYGGTSAGVIAAVTVAQEGRSVILIEPGRHLGGLSSGGLGWTDIGNKAAIGGLSREFYRRVGRHYGQAEAWTFAPHVAEAVFEALIATQHVRVVREHRLAPGGVAKEGARIARLTLDHAPPDGMNAPGAVRQAAALTIAAQVFLDCSYEGDLMAGAGVAYTVGREAVQQYGEPLNGVRAVTPKHQFTVAVDPYVKPGDPASGLIPFVQAGAGEPPGAADRSVQAYNFRLCLTRQPDNQLPIGPPAGYDPGRFELFGRYIEALVKAGRKLTPATFLKIDPLPEGKTDINNQGAVSTDFIGQNYAYPDADYAERARIWHAHRDYIQGLLYFAGSSPRVPAELRAQMRPWGLCRDEFKDTGGWPHQMYVREARRMLGRHVVTQADCEHRRVAPDPIGLAAYNMDSHNCQRLVQHGAVRNEGDVQVRPAGPYPIGYASITPRAEECSNLLVPVCLAASHIAYGSIRMEPVFMLLGESAACAACAAVNEGCAVQRVNYPKLRAKLLARGQILEYVSPRKPALSPRGVKR